MQIDPHNPMSPVFAFAEDEAQSVQRMLETLVRALRIVPGGGKLKEEYWSYIYHSIRNAPVARWSNLAMRDFLHMGLGVEMKLLQCKKPTKLQGHRLMHPSASRRITFDPSAEPELSKVQVLRQFGEVIAGLRSRTAATCLGREPDIRWGILLWSPGLDEFLYFEERMREPNPDDFVARFVDVNHRGTIRRNLHIFEKATDSIRFSITRPETGAKVQPYFDVPLVGKGAYAFTVPHETLKPVWLKDDTINALQNASISRDRDMDTLINSALHALEQEQVDAVSNVCNGA